MVTVRGLNPRAEYTVSLRMRPADKYRYKFINMQWVPVGESEVLQNEERQIIQHPSSPNSGEFWMKKPISFKTVKVTHNSASKHGNVSTAWVQGVICVFSSTVSSFPQCNLCHH